MSYVYLPAPSDVVQALMERAWDDDVGDDMRASLETGAVALRASLETGAVALRASLETGAVALRASLETGAVALRASLERNVRLAAVIEKSELGL